MSYPLLPIPVSPQPLGQTILTAGVVLPVNCLGNDQFNVADPLETTKAYHRVTLFRQYETDEDQFIDDTVKWTMYIPSYAGTVVAASISCVTPPTGSDEVDLDIKKNGTTICNALANLDSTTTSREQVSVTIDTTANTFAAGDVITAELAATDVSPGELPYGVCIKLDIVEIAG
jgi:hypothetical protein